MDHNSAHTLGYGIFAWLLGGWALVLVVLAFTLGLIAFLNSPRSDFLTKDYDQKQQQIQDWNQQCYLDNSRGIDPTNSAACQKATKALQP